MLKSFINSEPTTPADQLGLAISSFASSLSLGGRGRFLNLKLQTRKKPPSRHAPYNLAADFDQGLTAKCDCRRVYGPRLISLLQSVQQFAALKESLPYGGELHLACDTWTVVEFCLTSVPREQDGLRTHVDEISRLFMEIGRSAPQHRSLFAYYERSEGLRKHLHEYYALVVDLCREICECGFMIKTPSRQSFESFMIARKILPEKINLCAKLIQQEADYLIAVDREQCDEPDCPPWSSHAIDDQFVACYWQKYKNDALRAASTLDHQALWKHVRKQATTDSFIKKREYNQWKKKERAATLICSGGPGVGKSVMLANMVDDLRRLDTSNIVTHFFCALDDVRTLEQRSILSSLLHQILDAFPADVFWELEARNIVTEDGLCQCDLLEPVFAKLGIKRVFFILDGFDACSEYERIEVIKSLRFLQNRMPLLVCISTTYYRRWRRIFEPLPSISKIEVTFNISQARNFLKKELRYCQRTGEIVLATNADKDSDIDKFLSNVTNPLAYPFNYTSSRLVLLYYAKATKFLDGRPSTDSLGEVSDLLYRLNQVNPSEETSSRLLKLMMAALEPLTLEQLHDALRINIDVHWPMAKGRPNPYVFVHAADFPVTIDEERQTAHIVEHLDLRFPTGVRVPRGESTDLDRRIADHMMARICLACLNGQDSRQSSLHKDTKRKSISSSLFESTTDRDSWSTDSETIDAYSRTSIESNTSTIRENTNSHTKSAFHAYASKYWLWHFIHVPDEDGVSIDLARNILSQKDQYLHYPNSWCGTVVQQTVVRETVVQWAWNYHHDILLGLLLNTGRHEQAYPILDEAVKSNDHVSINKLTALYPFDFGKISSEGVYLLNWHPDDTLPKNASTAGDESILHPCHRTGAQSLDSANRSPLWYAAREGNVAGVKSILNMGSTDPNAMDVNDMTPLAIAVAYNRLEVVQALLEWKGINVRVLDDDLCTPLQVAERYGFTKIAAELRAFEMKTIGSVLS